MGVFSIYIEPFLAPSSLADFEFTDELVEEVIQAARRRLMGESSEETKHYLRELVDSV